MPIKCPKLECIEPRIDSKFKKDADGNPMKVVHLNDNICFEQRGNPTTTLLVDDCGYH